MSSLVMVLRKISKLEQGAPLHEWLGGANFDLVKVCSPSEVASMVLYVCDLENILSPIQTFSIVKVLPCSLSSLGDEL